MRTVLIVDDSESSLTALELACSAIPGVETCFVRSAPDALRILQDQDVSISAVLTDIRMPTMDGFQLIQFIRAQVRHRDLPIIVVTGDTDPDTPERSVRLGADAYFAKPFSPRAIRLKLEQLLYANGKPA
jgi:CheY-like chemotaxis protein